MLVEDPVFSGDKIRKPSNFYPEASIQYLFVHCTTPYSNLTHLLSFWFDKTVNVFPKEAYFYFPSLSTENKKNI